MTVTDSTTNALVEQIFRLQRTIKHVTAHPRYQGGVGLAHVGLLFMLTGCEARRATDLADDLGVGASALSRQIAALQERELLTRRPDPDDGRASLLSITPAGRDLVDTVLTERAQRLKDLLSGWDEAEAEHATRTLSRLSDVFHGVQPDGGRARPGADDHRPDEQRLDEQRLDDRADEHDPNDQLARPDAVERAGHRVPTG